MRVGSRMRARCLAFLVVVLTAPWAALPGKAASGPEIEAEVRATLDEFFRKVGFSRALANRAVAILVFPTVVKAGFGIGGEYGEGALQIRGQTAGYHNIISGSIGFQLGAQGFSRLMRLPGISLCAPCSRSLPPHQCPITPARTLKASSSRLAPPE